MPEPADRQNWAILRQTLAARASWVALVLAWLVWYDVLFLREHGRWLLLPVTVAAVIAYAMARWPRQQAWPHAVAVTAAFACIYVAQTRFDMDAAVPFYVLPVLMAAVLVSPWAAPPVAAAACLSIATHQPADPALALPYASLIASVGLLAPLLVAEVWSELGNAWRQVERVVALVSEVRLRQEQVNGLNKALHVSNALLKRSLRELATAQQEAAQARQLKEQFATTVSHELRTPLNIILGFLEMMRRYPEVYGDVTWTPSLRSDIDEIQGSAQYLSDLVDDILDLARVGALRMTIRREQVDVAEVIREVVAVTRRVLRGKDGVGLRAELPTTMPPLHVDRTRIRQVLLNLLANACRFTEAGEIVVRAELRPEDVVISVSDTGSGIPEDRLKAIFEEFMQSGMPGMEGIHGTGKGLGLAIAKRFVQLHGGRIWAESTVGVGSTFSFTLPLTDKQVSLLGMQPVARATTRQATPTVVFVGESDGLDYLQRHLEGYTLVHGTDLAQARHLVREQHPHAIVLNVPPDAPDARVGAPPVFVPEHVPLIQCSLPVGHGPSPSSGFDHWLMKPISSDSLYAILDAYPSARRLMLVDDDPAFIRLLRRMLEASRQGYEIGWARSGEEALAKLRTRPADLVFLDIALPGLSGRDVAAMVAGSATADTAPTAYPAPAAPGAAPTPAGTAPVAARTTPCAAGSATAHTAPAPSGAVSTVTGATPIAARATPRAAGSATADTAPAASGAMSTVTGAAPAVGDAAPMVARAAPYVAGTAPATAEGAAPTVADTAPTVAGTAPTVAAGTPPRVATEPPTIDAVQGVGLTGADVLGTIDAARAGEETRPVVIAVTAGRPESGEAERAPRTFAVTFEPGFTEGDVLALTQACLAQLRPEYTAGECVAGSP